MGYYTKSFEEIDWKSARIAADPLRSPYERETYIRMNEETDIAVIDAMSPAWIKHLIQHPEFTCDPKGVTCTKDRNDKEIIVAISGTLPKNCIRTSIRPRKRFDRL